MFIEIESIDGTSGAKFLNIAHVVAFTVVQNVSVWEARAVIGTTNYSNGGTNVHTALIRGSLGTQVAAEAIIAELIEDLGVID